MPVHFDPETFIEGLRSLLPPRDLLIEPADKAPFLTDWRHSASGEALAVCLPRNSDTVAALMRHCAEYGVAVTPQGGNTSLAAGSVPSAASL